MHAWKVLKNRSTTYVYVNTEAKDFFFLTVCDLTFFSNQPLRILRRWLSHKTFKLIKLYATTYNGVGFLYILKRNNFRAATFTLQKIKVHTILNAWMVPNYAMYSKINLWKKVINMSYAKSKMFWLHWLVQSWRAILLVGPKHHKSHWSWIDFWLVTRCIKLRFTVHLSRLYIQ